MKLLRKGVLKTYRDLPHGMPTTHADIVNADLLAFIRQEDAPAEERGVETTNAPVAA